MMLLSASWLSASLVLSAGAGEAPSVDEKAKTVTLPARVAKQGAFPQLKGAIEYVLVSKGGKDYKALFVTDCTPAEVHEALLKIGLKPGRPAGKDSPPAGMPVRIQMEFEKDGKKVRRPVDELVVYKKTGKPLEGVPWTFTGSTAAFDPQSGKEAVQCTITKNLIGLHYSDSSPLLQNPRAEAREENIYAVDLKALPPESSAVRLIFEREEPKVAKGTRRVHAFVKGQVQGVGFREFTQREARRLGLAGFVLNLPDGRVEAVVEGPKEKVDELVEKLKRGPRAAKVEGLDAKDEPPEGIAKNFEIR